MLNGLNSISATAGAPVWQSSGGSAAVGFGLSPAVVLVPLLGLAFGSALIVALGQWRHVLLLFAGLGIVAGSAFAALVSFFWIGPAGIMNHPMAGWAIVALPVISCLCFVSVVLAPSPRLAKRSILIAALLLAAMLYGLDSCFHVKFCDKDGRPVAGGYVEVLHQSYFWGSSSSHPVSGADGIAYVGLMRAGCASQLIAKARVVDNTWPKKAVTSP